MDIACSLLSRSAMNQALWDSGWGILILALTEYDLGLSVVAVDRLNILDAVIDGDRLAISLPGQRTFACAELYAFAPTPVPLIPVSSSCRTSRKSLINRSTVITADRFRVGASTHLLAQFFDHPGSKIQPGFLCQDLNASWHRD